MSIKLKLPLLAIIIVSISLILVSSIFYVQASTSLEEQNRDQMEHLLNAATRSLEGFFWDRKVELQYLSEHYFVQESLKEYIKLSDGTIPAERPDYQELNKFFMQIIADREDMRDVFVLSPFGNVIASSEAKSLWIDLSFREYFEDAMKDIPSISTLLQDKVDNENVLFLAYPIHDNMTDEVIGVIAAVIDRSDTSKMLSELVDDSVGNAYIVDSNGLIVYHVNKNLVGSYHRGVIADIEEVSRVFSSTDIKENQLTYSVDGTQYYMTYKQIEKVNQADEQWTLLIEQNTSILFQSRNQMVVLALVTTLLVMLAAVIAFLWLARTITTPITSLSQVMERTKSGDLKVRAQVQGKDELTQLATHFNGMLDALITSYQESEHQKQNLLLMEEELSESNEELREKEEALRSNNLALLEQQKQLQISQKKVETIAFTNPLTSLANRLAYVMDIDKAIKKDLLGQKHFSIYQLDVDNFMRINEFLGHGFGDKVLIELAQRLYDLEKEKIRLYHLSADEFAFIDDQNIDEFSITKVMEKIYKAFNEPFSFEEKKFYLSVSTGIATYPTDGDYTDKLIQHADTAMFEAKKNGRANYVFYKKVMSESVSNRIEIEELLRSAIDQDFVSMMYQPQYRVEDESLRSFEALMRMKNAQGKSLSPAAFIPIAEDTGHIVELGYWAFEDVCKTVKRWQREDLEFSHISVNVSGIQLKQPDFIQKIKNIMEKERVSTEHIEIEITESILIDALNKNNSVLEELYEMGFHIALDDFGTGYSSFSYLSRLPLHTLKIDKSFIDNINTSKKDRDLIRQMIDIAHELGMYTIAEGVETRQQVELLKEYKADCIQGYYFSKPLIEEDAIDLMQKDLNENIE